MTIYEIILLCHSCISTHLCKNLNYAPFLPLLAEETYTLFCLVIIQIPKKIITQLLKKFKHILVCIQLKQ